MSVILKSEMLLKLKLSHPPLLSLFRLRSWKNDTERVVLYWRIVFYHDSTVTANQDSSEEGGGGEVGDYWVRTSIYHTISSIISSIILPVRGQIRENGSK